jgi:hypothetical protein
MIASDLVHHKKEAVMGQTIPDQHPAVVLRAQYRQLRALLAVAMVAVVGLAAAVVVLALDDDGDAGLGSATQVVAPVPSDAVRSDGGPEESAVAATLGSQPTAVGTEESRVAAAIGSARNASTENGGPDESAVARAISGR